MNPGPPWLTLRYLATTCIHSGAVHLHPDRCGSWGRAPASVDVVVDVDVVVVAVVLFGGPGLL